MDEPILTITARTWIKRPGPDTSTTLCICMMCMHDVSVIGLQDQHEKPLTLPGIHHLVRDRGAAIGYIMRQPSDVFLCLPWGGKQHGHIQHIYTHWYAHVHTLGSMIIRPNTPSV